MLYENGYWIAVLGSALFCSTCLDSTQSTVTNNSSIAYNDKHLYMLKSIWL